jgi:hypothetical protein
VHSQAGRTGRGDLVTERKDLRYLELDSLEFGHHPDIAAAYATEYRQQPIRRQQAPPESVAEAVALVAQWRAEDRQWMRDYEAARQQDKQRDAVSAVLTEDVVRCFLEALI